MNDFQPYQIDSGASSVVLRISPDRVSKYAKPQYVDFIRGQDGGREDGGRLSR